MEQSHINFHERVSALGEVLRIVKGLPEKIMVDEGQDVRFSATVSSSDYSVKWFKNGDEIVNGDRFFLSRNGNTATLLIKKVVPEDAGEYSVQFINKEGPIVSKTSLFVVLPE